MKIDLAKLLKTVGWNVGLIAVFSSVLLMFGVELGAVITVAESMAGLQLGFSLCINVLKWAGVVNDGTSGKWSAAFNLLGLAGIAVTLSANPAFDFVKLDAQLVDIARFGTLIFGYIVQIAGTKYMHQSMTYGLGVKAFKARAA